MQHAGGTVSRRVFIQFGVGTGAGLLVAACSGPPAPSSAPTTSSAPTSVAATSSAAVSATSAPVVPSTPAAAAPRPRRDAGADGDRCGGHGQEQRALPNYIAPNLVAKPDYDAHDPRVTLAWDNYPKNPPTSWNKPAPGTGSTVTAFAVDYYPPPTPYDGNPTWQAVNKALNADFQMTQVAGPDYPLRMATMMAGNDIPDIIHLLLRDHRCLCAAGHGRVRQGQVPGPDAVSRRRRHQGLSQPGGHSDLRLDKLVVRRSMARSTAGRSTAISAA